MKSDDYYLERCKQLAVQASTKGNAAPEPWVTVTVIQSSLGSASATPFGRDVQTCILFAPNTSGTAFNGTETLARDARLPVQLNVCVVVAFLFTVIVTDVSGFEPKFLNVTVKGIVASQVIKPVGGILTEKIFALFNNKTKGTQPFDVVRPTRSGKVMIAVFILAAWFSVKRVIQASSA